MSDDKRQLVVNAVSLGQGFNLLDGCCCQRNFMNDGACDDAVGGKMEQFVSTGGAANRIQADAVQGVCHLSVGGMWFVVGLNTAAKGMLTIDVAIQRKMCDDSMG